MPTRCTIVQRERSCNEVTNGVAWCARLHGALCALSDVNRIVAKQLPGHVGMREAVLTVTARTGIAPEDGSCWPINDCNCWCRAHPRADRQELASFSLDVLCVVF